jgi:hypothetical protein
MLGDDSVDGTTIHYCQLYLHVFLVFDDIVMAAC